MDSLDKFKEVMNLDNRDRLTELPMAFLWYHCRASEARTADIPTLLQYFNRAGFLPPSEDEIKASFANDVGIVSAGGGQYRVKQDNLAWYRDKCEAPVFNTGLDVFTAIANTGPEVVREVAPEVPEAEPTGWRRHAALAHRRWEGFGRWAKDHPTATGITFLASIIGLLLAIK